MFHIRIFVMKTGNEFTSVYHVYMMENGDFEVTHDASSEFDNQQVHKVLEWLMTQTWFNLERIELTLVSW